MKHNKSESYINNETASTLLFEIQKTLLFCSFSRAVSGSVKAKLPRNARQETSRLVVLKQGSGIDEMKQQHTTFLKVKIEIFLTTFPVSPLFGCKTIKRRDDDDDDGNSPRIIELNSSLAGLVLFYFLRYEKRTTTLVRV